MTLGGTPRRRALGLAVLALVASAPAWAQQKPAGGVQVKIEPSRFYEVCLEMARNQTITYSFQADQVLDFDIHYHQDDAVIFPVKNTGLLGLTDSFTAPSAQTYCLMWTNPQVVSATLGIRLEGP
jgi:hypothetical protein